MLYTWVTVVVVVVSFVLVLVIFVAAVVVVVFVADDVAFVLAGAVVDVVVVSDVCCSRWSWCSRCLSCFIWFHFLTNSNLLIKDYSTLTCVNILLETSINDRAREFWK